MQYLLTKEEYKNLIPKESMYDMMNKVTELNKKVLELFNGGKCLKNNGGYCDLCPISKNGTDTCGDYRQIYSK